MIDPTSPEMARIQAFMVQLHALQEMLFESNPPPSFHGIGIALEHGRLLAHDLEWYMTELYQEYEGIVQSDVTMQDTARTPIPDYLKDL